MRTFYAAAFALLAAPGVAAADPPAEPPAKEAAPREASSRDRARARRLFEEATELESTREWSRAADKLSEALGIVETPGLRYHLAFCQEEQGLMVEALGNYDRAEQLIAAGNKAPDVAELLVPKRDALRRRVPKLEVKVEPPALIDRVAIDGVLVAPELTNGPIPRNPGSYRVTVWAKSNPTPLHRHVALREGATHTETVAWPVRRAPVPAAAAPAPAPLTPPPAREPGNSARTVLLISEASLTAVALGLGVGFHLSANRAGEDADKLRAKIQDPMACSKPPLPRVCVELGQATDREELHGDISTVALIAGAVGAAGTIATFILWRPARGDAALGVSAGAMAGGGGLELLGRF